MLDAAHHRDNDAAGHGERDEDEGGFVADAAGRVLVDLGLGDAGEVDDLAGKHHLLGQVRGFLGGHVREVDRHHERRELVLRHFAIERTVNDVANFLLGELPAIALLFDQKLESWLDKPAGRNGAFRHLNRKDRREVPRCGKVCDQTRL